MSNVGVTINVDSKNGVKAVETLGKKTKQTTVDFTKFENSMNKASKTITRFENTIQKTSEKMLKLSESAARTERPVEKLGKDGADAIDKLNRELAEALRKIDSLSSKAERARRPVKKIGDDGKKAIDKLNNELDDSVRKLKKMNKEAGAVGRGINDGAKKARSGLIAFDNSMTLATIGIAGLAFGTFRLAKGIINLSDEYSLLRSQIRLVIDDSENLVAVQNQLLVVANETRQSFSSTAKLYARLDRATEQLFLTDKQVIAATETLNKAIIISGASAAESSAAIIQLSQGLASGALRGDELRSVLEQVPRVAKLIADGLGVTVGALRELGSQGKLTAEAVIGSIKSQTVAIDEEFEQIEKTSSQTWTVLSNNVNAYVTDLTAVTEAQKGFNSSLQGISDLFEQLNGPNLRDAKLVDVQNRSFEEQRLILREIINQKDFLDEQERKSVKIQEDGNIITRLRNSLLSDGNEIASKGLKEKLKLAEQDLALILARDKAESDKSDAERAATIAAKQAEKSRLEFLFAERKEAAFNEALADKSFVNAIKRNKELDDFLAQSFSTQRDANAEALAHNEQIAMEQLQLEQTLELEREALGATSLEMAISRIDEEANQRILKAGEVAQTESELIKFIEDITINAEEKKSKAKEKSFQDNKKMVQQGVLLAADSTAQIFDDNKGAALANIGARTAAATMRLYDDFPLPAAIGLTPFVVGVGLKQAANVNRQKLADGGVAGIVEGAGSSRSDSIDVSLANGEGVLNKPTVDRNGGKEFVDGLNGGGTVGGVINNFYITAGAGTDLDSLAQTVTDAAARASQLGLQAQG